jgi:N-formylglutamate amidohydrolase
MNTRRDTDLIQGLRCQTRLHGTSATGGFAYDLDMSAPFIAVALHAGHCVRDELLPLMQISEAQRLLEEDPATDRMIQGLPNAIWGLDSRAEYDLNRPPEQAVPLTPERFWGVRVYRDPPPHDMVRRSMEKYDAFYSFIESCLEILLERFGGCIVYDIHSYNRTRQIERGIDPPPVFNLGTALADREQWGSLIDRWLCRLKAVELDGVRVSVAENLVFSGKGEFCRRLTAWAPGVLTLPTEIAKVYMDERQGVLYPELVEALRQGLRKAIIDHVSAFRRCRSAPDSANR